MIPSVLIQACLLIYSIWFVCMLFILLKEKIKMGKVDKETLEEGILGLVFFPNLLISASVIIFLWQASKVSGSFGKGIANLMADGLHIFILIPSVLGAIVLTLPVYLWISRSIKNQGD